MKTKQLFLAIMLSMFNVANLSAYTVYYNPLTTNHYKFAVWSWEDGGQGVWSDWMTTVDNHDDWYQTSIRDGYNNVIFVKFDNSIGYPDWSEIEDKTSDLKYDGVNAYYVNGYGWQEDFLDPEEIDGLTYKLHTSTLTAEVTSSSSYSTLTTITIPSSVEFNSVTYSVTSIGREAFYRCANLTSIEIPNSVTSIGKFAFWGCIGLTSVTLPPSITIIEGMTFYNCSSLKNIEIPYSVISIGPDAFHNCSSLTSIVIPNSVINIDGFAFYGCSGLTSVTIGNSVTSIGNKAFYRCANLTSIEIPNSVTSIGEEAFYDCSALLSLSLGTNITSFGNQAFYNCSALTTIYNYRERPAKLGSNVFYNVDYFNCTLYVPDGSVEMYKSSGSDWKDFYFIESMGSAGDEYTVTYIDKDEEILDSEKIKLHLPEAPVIARFTFLGWRPVASFIESNTIVIEAVYEADDPTSASAEVSIHENSAQKLVRNGNVYILTGDKTYTLTGQAAK